MTSNPPQPSLAESAVPPANPASLLKEAGVRKTAARVHVLRILLSSGHPLSAQEVQDRLANEAIDPVTVYRTLHTLVETGLAREVSVGDRALRYEAASRPHGHFMCEGCNEVTCLDRNPQLSVAPALEALSEKGFEVHQQQWIVTGRCPRCVLGETLADASEADGTATEADDRA